MTLLQSSLRDLRALRYELLTTSFNISLVEAFGALGRSEEGVALVDATIESVQTNGDVCYLPELLRLKGTLLFCTPQPLDDQAESCFAQSLALSRRQGALAWELRTSIDLARRSAAQGKHKEAKALVQPVFERFADGSVTADLRTAESLLASWSDITR